MPSSKGAELVLLQMTRMNADSNQRMDVRLESSLKNLRFSAFIRGQVKSATKVEVGLILNFGPKPEFRRLAFDNARKQLRGAPPSKPAADEL